jgi:D-alanyl-D-alanine carboxypeptidase
MANMKTKVLTAVLVAGSLLMIPAAASHATVTGAPASGDRKEASLQRDADAVRAVGITGVQARSTKRSGRQSVVTSGVARIGSRRPVPANGYFRIGSVNKTFVATVVLQLAGEGTLSLDDTVERWLPGVVSGNGNDGRTITVQQLLQHTSGIHDDYPDIESAEEYYQHRYDIYTPRQIVARAMRQEPDFPPGTGWSYSNTGYVLLGMIIERVTGNPWYQEVHKRIIRPLGLRHTLWPGTDPSLPHPHANGYKRFTTGQPLVDVTELIDADASGGLLSTTADLNRFFLALLNGQLLHHTQLAQMQTTVPVDEGTEQLWPGARYGLGIFSRPLPCGGRYWAPAGDQDGYSTRAGITVDGRLAVVVSMSTQLRDSISSLLRQEQASKALIDHALCNSE